MTTPRIATIAFAATIVAILAFAAAAARPRPTVRPTRSTDQVRAELRRSIDALGMAGAYAALKTATADQDTATRHGEAHIFGELAYAKDGVDAIRVCDADFTFGCFHGLIVRALVTEGIGALAKIDAACVAAYGSADTGCRHGIGHGLVEFFGPRDLADALDRCASIQRPGLLGCTQGAFMEYASATADDPALFNRDRPLEPCLSVAPTYQASCAFEQPYLLTKMGGANGAGRRCADFAAADVRTACYLGFGRSVAELGGYDQAAVGPACDALEDDAGRIDCRAGAHWLFAALRKQEGSTPFCDGSDDRARCLADAALINAAPSP